MVENNEQHKESVDKVAADQPQKVNGEETSKMKRFWLGPYLSGEKKMSKKRKIVVIVILVMMALILAFRSYASYQANQAQKRIDEINTEMEQRKADRERARSYAQSDSWNSSNPEAWQ